MSERTVRPSELLAEDEVQLLRRALGVWGGPARCSDQLAVGMSLGDQVAVGMGLADARVCSIRAAA
jgi:hypothetical protein